MAIGVVDTVSLTTSPAALMAGSTHKTRRLALVKAHEDNTDDVAVGFSATLSADKTNANAGFILCPGEQVPIFLNEATAESDDDERDLYGVSASGTQYVSILLQ